MYHMRNLLIDQGTKSDAGKEDAAYFCSACNTLEADDAADQSEKRERICQHNDEHFLCLMPRKHV